ncbi:MAG: hypothetical protein ACRDOE_13385 [Streptosporangiaceae bacterium]
MARSLRSRQGFPTSLGLALWERYNREALAALAGHGVYILRYEELLYDPLACVSAVARWLQAGGCSPIRVDDADVAAAASLVSGKLAQHDGEGELPGVVGRAVETLSDLGGANEPLRAVEMPQPPPWMADAIAQRHEYEELYSRYMRYVKWRRRIPFFGRRARPGAAP